eukprot:768468-Hanusia_phi.AAC.1
MEKILQLPIKRRGRLLQEVFEYLQPLVLRHGMPVIRERRRHSLLVQKTFCSLLELCGTR